MPKRLAYSPSDGSPGTLVSMVGDRAPDAVSGPVLMRVGLIRPVAACREQPCSFEVRGLLGGLGPQFMHPIDQLTGSSLGPTQVKV